MGPVDGRSTAISRWPGAGPLGGKSVTALEMTKWFDTNYHYLVPELRTGQRFALRRATPVDESVRRLRIGVATRPVILGPVSFLLLSKHVREWHQPRSPARVVRGLRRVARGHRRRPGASWAQVDEPVLTLDLDPGQRRAFARTYARLREASPRLRLLVATYFAGLGDNLETALHLPVDALHLDAVADPDQVDVAVEQAPDSLALSLGVVDGRNIWRTDLGTVLSRLEDVRRSLGTDRLMVGPSCSLLHLPVDLGLEGSIDPELRTWLAFAVQRLGEIPALTRGLNQGREAIAEELGGFQRRRCVPGRIATSS